MKRVTLEICAGSIDDAIAADAGGADRIELNSSLMLGGLTPSLGTLIEVRRAVGIPIMCMVRPRAGGFCYTSDEMKTMELDVELAVSHLADGVVFGVLTSDGEIDFTRMKRLIERANSKEVVFHRAFDVVPDPFLALDQLVDLGVTRILTSGQEATVYNGTDLIRRLIGYAADRIQILPGGGIDSFNLADIIARTGCDQIHMATPSLRTDTSSASRPQVYFGGELRPSEVTYIVSEAEDIRGITNMLGGMRTT